MMDTALSLKNEERVRGVHEKALVIDSLGGYGFEYSDILAAGVNVVHVTMNMYASENFEYVLNMMKRYYGVIEMDPGSVMLVEKADDIPKAKRQGKLGIIFGFQNGAPLGDDITLLYIFYKLGVRVIQITYNEINALGCGCLEPTDTGLTSFGKQVVRAMNRLGILVDLSHTGYRTSREAIEVSELPAAFTHGNPATLKNIPRNRPDELIKLIAEKGGYIGLTPYAAFCKSAPDKRPTIDDYIDQIDYVVQMVGIDHVGIGTDKFEGKSKEEFNLGVLSRYSGLINTPFEERHVEGFSHIRHFPRITDGLISRGYSDEDCGKILGANFYSLLKKVWKDPVF